MSAGQFATARRGIHPEDLRHAQSLLDRGYGFQNVARITSICEADLRMFCVRQAPHRPLPQMKRSVRSFVPRPVVQVERWKKQADKATRDLPCTKETRRVIASVADACGVSVQDLIGPCRQRRFAMPRQWAYYAVHKARPDLSLPAIAAIFADRDHTTILHGIKRHEERVAWCEVLILMGQPSQMTLDLWGIAA